MRDREMVMQHFQDAIEASGNNNKWRFVRLDIIEKALALLKERNQDEKRFTAYEVCMALIYHGQSDERFKWGEVIKYSPSEVEKILKGEM